MVRATLQLDDHRRAIFAWRPGTIRAKGLPCGVVVTHLPDAARAGHLPAASMRSHSVSVLWSGSEPQVELESIDPLTLVGTVSCSCGDEGRIEGGRWIQDCWVPPADLGGKQ